MAALLYLGETVHARHLWRRTDQSERDGLLSDWWNVGKALIGGESPEEALRVCSNHPAPLNTYANQVANAAARGKMKTEDEGQSTEALAEDIIAFLETKKWNA